MADAADDTGKKPSAEEGAALDETLQATPGSSGGGRPVLADATSLEVDTSDRYALGEVHAAGGLGRVMRARDRRLHRTVAVKELLQRTPAAEARFVREALITAQLEHPGIVPVHDAGRWPSGEPYYSMKLVSGRTLRDLIQTRKGLDERLALVPNALAVAEAIAYAHSRDVIHRDIKPPNVLVGDFGETLVIDWGLAKDLSGRVAEPAVEEIAVASGSGSGDLATAVGNVLGTPAYMSPEQARGDDLDARADVYSLGALLYEVLTGKPPHEGGSVQDVLASAQKGEVMLVSEREPDVPHDLCAIVRKAMQPERADRYPTAMEMAADLRRYQTGKLVTARRYSTRALVWRWVARHRAIVSVVAAAAAALAVVGVVSFRRVMTQRNRAETQMRLAESRSDELVFRQAENLLERDPTAALAYLKSYPEGGERAGEVGAMIDEAEAAGVARHVLAHEGWVMQIGFAPDGRLVTVDALGNLSSWDAASGRGRRILRHSGVKDAELSPDASLLAIPFRDGHIEVQPTAGGPARRLVGMSGPVRPIFSRDGRHLTAMWNGVVRVWELASGRTVVSGSDDANYFGALSPDGTRFYIARRSGEVVEQQVDSPAPPRIAFRLEQPALWLSPLPGGTEMLLSDVDDVIQIVDLASGRPRVLGRHRMREDGWVEVSHAGDRVAISLADSTIALFALAGGPPTVLRGHSDPAYRMVFSPDDRLLFSVSDDATARIWDLGTGEVQVLRGHQDDVSRLALSPDGAWLATASFDRTARVWPVRAGSARVIAGQISDPEKIVFADGGARVATGNRDRQVESIELASGQSTRFSLESWKQAAGLPAFGNRTIIAADERGGATLYDVATGEASPLPHQGDAQVFAVAISQDDARAVTVDLASRFLLWDVARGEGRRVAMRRAPRLVSFLPGGREAILAHDGLLERWDLEAGEERASVATSLLTSHLPKELLIAQNGEVVVSRGGEGNLVVWNLGSGQVDVIAGLEVEGAAVSPDGARVAIALGDRTVRVWEAASRSTREALRHDDLIYQLTFSPDGSQLASCSFDRTVRLWNVESGRRRVLRGHGREVTAIAFSPDGGSLASVGADGTMRLWRLAALPDDRPSAVRARLTSATTAVVGRDSRALTPHR